MAQQLKLTQASVLVYRIDSRRLAMLRRRGKLACDVCSNSFGVGGYYAAKPRTGSRRYCLVCAISLGFDLVNHVDPLASVDEAAAGL
ncbi:MAG: hypothetical protein JRN17_05500 [Nitrososphaerota archaeon]|jgi:hypothetical protein|nr:hypothetical protein [Nitrososphaerota archaeon]MDG6981757.1 hypothetical protein [Nitrososphaerota archaeon]MDG6990554.1 hypothetical protein [Nitrososphaerota archaeon]MDG7012526.1 hypothetical protein [Nitrososphaerota archaeon]